MRVLFTCVVGQGHFNPMVPLARAFEGAGHTVAVATDPDFTEHVRRVGFTAFPAGLDMSVALRRFYRTMPAWRDVAPWDQIRLIVPGLFAGVRVGPMLDDLAGIIARWRPDLLIHESGEMAGSIAAEVAGIGHVEHSYGVLRPLEHRRLAMTALQPVCDALGVPNVGIGGLGGEVYLDVCPPALQRPEIADVPQVLALRPVGFDDAPDAVVPSWLTGGRGRPLVYVTMGTAFNDRPAVFREILAGLAAERLDLLVTVGFDGDPQSFGTQPDNVRIERFVPQSAVLPHAAAFVSHGGSGALLGAARAGVPMLAVPQGADQFLNAERIVDSGLGLRLMPAELNPEAVRSSVRRLLDEPGFALAARAMRVEIDRMPPPESIVARLAAGA